jgi:hypothetical protein
MPRLKDHSTCMHIITRILGKSKFQIKECLRCRTRPGKKLKNNLLRLRLAEITLIISNGKVISIDQKWPIFLKSKGKVREEMEAITGKIKARTKEIHSAVIQENWFLNCVVKTH